MQIRHFPAIIEAAETEGYGVFFPDLPGCTSGGSTIEEAARNAEEALAGHLRAMVEEHLEIPEPTPADQIPHEEDINEAARMLVRAELPGRSVRFNASFEESLLAAVDREAERRATTRSGFLAAAARRLLREEA